MASDLSLYPNPFGFEGIQINKPGDFMYKLTDPSGVLFDEGKSNSSIVIGKNLHPGIYILTLENEKGKVVRKIMRK